MDGQWTSLREVTTLYDQSRWSYRKAHFLYLSLVERYQQQNTHFTLSTDNNPIYVLTLFYLRHWFVEQQLQNTHETDEWNLSDETGQKLLRSS